MECAVVGLIVIVSLIGMGFAMLPAGRGGQWNEAFAHVARRFHGMLHPGGWLHWPSVWLHHGAAQVRLNVLPIRRSGGERCMQLAIQQREVASHCEIYYYQTRATMLPVSRGLLPVEFDWGDFRRRWQVLAEDGDATRHLLSDGVRLAIELLWRQPVPSEMTISLSPGWLVVRKVWHSPRGADLETFVERACGLSDQINLAAAAGIEFVVGEQVQLLEDARCGVCGDALASELVVCKRCNTPHHRECWQYGGGCATYGCGGRECSVPGVAPLAAPHWDSTAMNLDRPLKPR
jgi:Prokaryotic RING finger family 1